MGPVVEFDLSKFNVNMAKIPVILVNAIRAEIKNQLVKIQLLAQKKHRHKTHTGTLNSSIQVNMINNFSGEVGFEPGINRTEYGKYVHEGHGTWKPDRFLYEALAARETTIKADLEAAINSGLAAAGLL